MLVHYNPDRPIRLAGDAPAYAIACIMGNGIVTTQLLFHRAWMLNQSERNYSQVEKETLSFIFGVKGFHTYFYGRKFTLVTDTIGSCKTLCLSLHSFDSPTAEHSNAERVQDCHTNTMDSASSIFNMQRLDSLPVSATQISCSHTYSYSFYQFITVKHRRVGLW